MPPSELSKCQSFQPSLPLDVWTTELDNDPDKDFLLQGIAEGFRLTDEHAVFQPAFQDNYSSATGRTNRVQVESQIQFELSHGHYKLCNSPPTIISALGAIPKPDSTQVRLIHDCSQPAGSSLNDFASVDKMSFETIDDAVKLMSPKCFLAKVDLQSAYRSVAIHPDDYMATGLQWIFAGDSMPTYMFDSRLPFGARRAPGIFHRLTQAVKRMMHSRGFTGLVVYLDDFLILESSYERCLDAMHTLIKLLRQLGFSISWKKVEGPTQRLTFLGIEFNSETQTLHLPMAKLQEFRTLLTEFRTRTRASRRQLQQLAGKLNWACQVIRGGRTYLRRILNLIQPLRQANHKIRLDNNFYADIDWWINYIDLFNCRPVFAIPTVDAPVFMDACSSASGIFFNGDWQYTVFNWDWPDIADFHINYKEVLSLILAARRWGHLWTNCNVKIFTDNTTARAIINKGTCRNPVVMCYLRELFWIAATHNFSVQAVYIRGSSNILADSISRLHEPGQLWFLEGLLYDYARSHDYLSASMFALPEHMSNYSFLSLLPQVQTLRKQRESWI